MAALSDVLTAARKIAYTDSNGITDADGIIFANDALYEVQEMLIKRREDLFLQETQHDITAAMISGGASPGKVLFPTDMLFLKAIEINTTDSTQQNQYRTAKQIELSNLDPQGSVSFDWLRANQTSLFPKFAPHGDWFEIFPTPTATMANGIKLLYYLQPTDFVATSDTIVFPYSLNYRVLAYKIAAYYHAQNSNYDDQKLADGKAEKLIDNLIKLIGSQVQQPTQASGVGLTGGEF